MTKCFETNSDVNLALLHIRSTPIGARAFNPTAILTYGPIIRILLKSQQSTLIYNYDEDHYYLLKLRQNSLVKKNDTLHKHVFILTGSTVAVQREDSRTLMHGTVMDHGSDVDCGWPYKIYIRKTGRMVSWVA